MEKKIKGMTDITMLFDYLKKRKEEKADVNETSIRKQTRNDNNEKGDEKCVH